jgi:hypothetical protein
VTTRKKPSKLQLNPKRINFFYRGAPLRLGPLDSIPEDKHHLVLDDPRT